MSSLIFKIHMNFYYNDKIENLGENKLCVTLYQKPIFYSNGILLDPEIQGPGNHGIGQSPCIHVCRALHCVSS